MPAPIPSGPSLRVQLLDRPGARLPRYQTEAAAGLDVHAALAKPLVVPPGARCLVPTGLILELPPGHEGQVRPRSGLALRAGLTVLNAPGTIDADYRGEVRVLLINHGEEAVTIHAGDRVAQLVVAPVTRVEVETAPGLSHTARGKEGFGSTGMGASAAPCHAPPLSTHRPGTRDGERDAEPPTGRPRRPGGTKA